MDSRQEDRQSDDSYCHGARSQKRHIGRPSEKGCGDEALPFCSRGEGEGHHLLNHTTPHSSLTSIMEFSDRRRRLGGERSG